MNIQLKKNLKSFLVNKPLLKFPKFNYNHRMEVTKTMLKKDQKILKDLERMNDLTEFNTLALSLQSDLFHEQLFSNLTSSLKGDRDTKNKVRDLASRAGLKSDAIYNQYHSKFNNFVVTLWKELQADILKRAETDPSLLKCDPVWREKMQTSEGFQEYLESQNVEITPETCFNYPEINQLFLDTNPENVVKSFAELYFAGLIDEDHMRFGPHYSAMKEYLQTFEEEINGTLTVNNEMWVTKLKSDTYNYIKIVLSPEFKKESLGYAKTEDNMRVDVGLIVQREPIFLDTTNEDMEFGKYRRQAFKKYYYNIDKHLEELDSFNDVASDYWEVCTSQFKTNVDNKPNIRRWNQDKKAYDFYCSNSKHWSLVDPNVDDVRSIQSSALERVYMLCKNKKTGEYEFPTTTLYNGDSFYDAKFKLFFCLSQDEFKLFYKNPYPLFHVTRDFHNYEKEDPKNAGFSGVRTFYYEAHHFRGAPKVTPNAKHPYVDFVLSTKRKLSSYVNKNYWGAVINSLQER